MVNKRVDTKFEWILKDFKAIDFSGNKIFGKIPESIGSLKGLRLLNLSSNGFNIPQSLANLTNLEALDLSQNQLSGQIPQDLASLSFLSIMNFSHNNLQRPIPRSTQFQRQNCSAFMDNPTLYGLEDICEKIHVLNPTPQESEDLFEPKEQVISWISAGIAYGPGVFCGLVIGHRFSPRIHNWFM
uniref:Leucine-rich repeat-containing N-terminal plant-type domain-containing protein n=1 Tax=Brassica oleracea var. oleracea TaxID=109376 RepID=A0A0D3BKF3_BRAOL